jgi:hypothetical protein
MKALFADLAERSRQQRAHSHAYLADERTQVLALFDVVQVALAKGQDDQVSILLRQMRSIVDPVVARRRRVGLRMSA